MASGCRREAFSIYIGVNDAVQDKRAFGMRLFLILHQRLPPLQHGQRPLGHGQQLVFAGHHMNGRDQIDILLDETGIAPICLET